MRLALWGMHEPTQRGIVHSDWDEHWGLAHDLETPLRCDQAFEAHSEEIVRTHNPAHVDRLKSLAQYMRLTTAWNWSCELGPMHRVVQYSSLAWGARIESSVAYMMACALQLRPKAIGVFGVDMAEGEEYGYQRPNMAYLVGVARGMGIRVELHHDSRLMRSEWTGGCYGHPDNVSDMEYRLGPRSVAEVVQDGEVVPAA